MTVHSSFGVVEPTDILTKNQAYELILQPTGNITIDWAGFKKFTFK